MQKRSSALRVDPGVSDDDRGEAVAPLDLRQLAHLDLDELRAIWLRTVGRPAPKTFRRGLLLRALVYEIQVKKQSGMSAALKARLRNLATAAREGRFDETLGANALKPGTMLVRLWQGQTHRVMVMRDGYVWNGEQFGSLSTIAKRITRTSWNGWTFFGVKRPRTRNKNALRDRPAAADSVEERQSAPRFPRITSATSADEVVLVELSHV